MHLRTITEPTMPYNAMPNRGLEIYGGNLVTMNEVLAAHQVQQRRSMDRPASAFGDAVCQRYENNNGEDSATKRRRLEIQQLELEANYERAKASVAKAKCEMIKAESEAIKVKNKAGLATIAVWKAAFMAARDCPAIGLPYSASVRVRDMIQTIMFGTGPLTTTQCTQTGMTL